MYSRAYSSQSLIQFDADSLQALTDRAAACNEVNRITGFLQYRSGRFFQYLEGEEKAVVALMERIRADDRHDVLREVEMKCEVRLFPTWYMRLCTRSELASVQLFDLLLTTLDCAETLGNEDRLQRLLSQQIGRVAELHMRFPKRH